MVELEPFNLAFAADVDEAAEGHAGLGLLAYLARGLRIGSIDQGGTARHRKGQRQENRRTHHSHSLCMKAKAQRRRGAGNNQANRCAAE